MTRIANWMQDVAILCEHAETIENFEKTNAKDIIRLGKEVQLFSRKFPVPSI
jgi:hypothetical protein